MSAPVSSHTILKVIEILERALAVVQFMDCEIKDDTIKVMRCDRDSLDNLRYQLHELQQQIADSLTDEEHLCECGAFRDESGQILHSAKCPKGAP